MLRPGLFVASSIFLSATFSVCQTVVSQNPESIPQSPIVEMGLNSESLVLELDRAIVVLKRGLDENWETRTQYLSAFEETPSTDSAGHPVTGAKQCVASGLALNFRNHQPWDEGLPIGVEARRMITAFTKWRDEAAQRKSARAGSSNPAPQYIVGPIPLCDFPVIGTVRISASTAAIMHNNRIDPIYPPDALRNHVSGTVVLDATISIHGRVETLRVISGPASLQQAAIDAVKQWTYTPYMLNGKPVEIETTISVVFARPR